MLLKWAANPVLGSLSSNQTTRLQESSNEDLRLWKGYMDIKHTVVIYPTRSQAALGLRTEWLCASYQNLDLAGLLTEELHL